MHGLPKLGFLRKFDQLVHLSVPGEGLFGTPPWKSDYDKDHVWRDVPFLSDFLPVVLECLVINRRSRFQWIRLDDLSGDCSERLPNLRTIELYIDGMRSDPPLRSRYTAFGRAGMDIFLTRVVRDDRGRLTQQREVVYRPYFAWSATNGKAEGDGSDWEQPESDWKQSDSEEPG